MNLQTRRAYLAGLRNGLPGWKPARPAGTAGTRRPVTAGVQLAVYRIVQESLTNIRKHARTATGATVRLRYRADSIDVDVIDDGQAPGRQPATGGQGIVGLRERAAA